MKLNQKLKIKQSLALAAGIDRPHWPLLQQNAQKVYDTIKSYFGSVVKPSIASLILPYTLGVVLDDLAQPPSYSSKSHLMTLDLLISKISKNEIRADVATLLTEFPASFQKIIDLSRSEETLKNQSLLIKTIDSLVHEISKSSLNTVPNSFHPA